MQPMLLRQRKKERKLVRQWGRARCVAETEKERRLVRYCGNRIEL